MATITLKNVILKQKIVIFVTLELKITRDQDLVQIEFLGLLVVQDL